MCECVDAVARVFVVSTLLECVAMLVWLTHRPDMDWVNELIAVCVIRWLQADAQLAAREAELEQEHAARVEMLEVRPCVCTQ